MHPLFNIGCDAGARDEAVRRGDDDRDERGGRAERQLPRRGHHDAEGPHQHSRLHRHAPAQGAQRQEVRSEGAGLRNI